MRVRRCALLVSVLTLLAVPAAAQSTTEDGIRAVLRGEYQTAARILQPLAFDRAQPDPVAQFFLAALYETDKGVRLDLRRACGLYTQSAARPNPFSQQAAAMAASLRAQWNDPDSSYCVADESWEGGPPQSFVLGPNHRIVFTNTNITVAYGNQERRTNVLKRPGEMFPPIRYVPLEVTRPTRARRDFFHWFQWMPDTPVNPSSWTLGWGLSEVVGDQWLMITGDGKFLVVEGRTPPPSSDLAKLVRLQLNASGEAVLRVSGGSSSRTEVIPWAPRR